MELSQSVRDGRVRRLAGVRLAGRPGRLKRECSASPGKAELADPLFVETVVLDGTWRVPEGMGTQHGRRYRIAWFDPPFRPSLEEATQALGICVTADRRIVLVTWNGEDWTLPGGAPEPGETLEQALAREVLEEACARVVSSSYIGCQRVEEFDGDGVAYYQTRFWARVALDEFNPEYEMMARRLVPPQEFCGVLFWGEEATAHLILDRGLAIEDDLRKQDRETRTTDGH